MELKHKQGKPGFVKPGALQRNFKKTILQALPFFDAMFLRKNVAYTKPRKFEIKLTAKYNTIEHIKVEFQSC